jgi:hypothetical protein
MYIDPRTENRAIRIRPKSEWPEIKNKTLALVRAMADGTVM